jgi:GH15 family glucan-1,4-alpha-glucosidase
VTLRDLRTADGYLPIENYSVIGDCRTVSLVGQDGSIDWLCLPRFDAPSVFGRLLDARRGGYWQLCPATPCRVRQRYRDRTNIVDTVFLTQTGVVVVTDFMPVTERSMRQHAKLHDDPRVVRLVMCLSGSVRMHNIFRPAPDYGMAKPVLHASNGHLHTDTDSLHLCLRATMDMEGSRHSFSLQSGEAAAFALRAARPHRCTPLMWHTERAMSLLRTTQQYWWRWIADCRYDGPYQVHVWRSALALKLMTYAPTGAIVAAPTTSLPEWIGAGRNWDYRATWLRDASFTLFAFFQLGFHEEARSYFHWLSHRHLARRGHNIPNLFDLDGHAGQGDRELPALSGYRSSKPVRLGNSAVSQLQLDVYGEVMDSAYVYARFGGEVSAELWQELHSIVELAIDRWTEDDSSIWEVRSQRLPYTYSKMMCWVAVDRGLRIATRYNHPHDTGRWRRARAAMHRAVITNGYSQKRRAFTQSFGSDELDSAILRMSQVRFLPDRDPRIISTVRAIERELSAGVLVRRYLTESSDDGVGGQEGAFFMTSFWLADALAHLGDVEGAQRRFERLLAYSSEVGLFSEEVDPNSGTLLGNYPQAFTHLALVGAAVNIERARHRRIGVRGLRGVEPKAPRSAAPRRRSA